MKKRIATALGIVTVLAAFAGAAYAAQGTLFEGAWEGVDVDGSNQWMWIEDFAGVHEVLFYDDLCSACTGIQGEGPACLGVSSARLSDVDRLSIDGGVVTCMWLGDPQVLITDLTGSFVSNSDGTLSDDYGNVWTPSNDSQKKVISPPPVLPPTPTPAPNQVPEFDDTGFCEYALQVNPAVGDCSCQGGGVLTDCTLTVVLGASWVDLWVHWTDPDGDTMTHQMAGSLPFNIDQQTSVPGDLALTGWVDMEEFSPWGWDDISLSAFDGRGGHHQLDVEFDLWLPQ